MTHTLPPSNTSGTTKGVGSALAAALSRAPAAAEPVSESEVQEEPATTLGALRAATEPAPDRVEEEDGTPEMAWDPATRFAGVPEPPPRPRTAPTSSSPPAAAHALTQPAQEVLGESQLPPSVTAPSLAALVRGALRSR